MTELAGDPRHWFIAIDGNQSGPHAHAELVSMVAEGRIGPTTPVWREGLPDWMRLSDADELAALLRKSPPPLESDPFDADAVRNGPSRARLRWSAGFAFALAGLQILGTIAGVLLFSRGMSFAVWTVYEFISAAMTIFILLTVRSALTSREGTYGASIPILFLIAFNALRTMAFPLDLLLDGEFGFVYISSRIMTVGMLGTYVWLAIMLRTGADPPIRLVPYVVASIAGLCALLIRFTMPFGGLILAVSDVLLGLALLNLAKESPLQSSVVREASPRNPQRWLAMYGMAVGISFIVGFVLHVFAIAGNYESDAASPAITLAAPMWLVFETPHRAEVNASMIIVGILYFAILWTPLGVAAITGRFGTLKGVIQAMLLVLHLVAGFLLAALNDIQG